MSVVTGNLPEDGKRSGPVVPIHQERVETDGNESACSGDTGRHRTDAETLGRQRRNKTGDGSTDERREREHGDVEGLKCRSHGRADGLGDRSASGRPQRLQPGDREQQSGERLRAYFFVTFVEDVGTAMGAGGDVVVVVVVVVIGTAPGAVRGGGVCAGAKPIGRL